MSYSQYINNLEQASKENVDFLRDVSIKTMASLLTQHPEQEKTLLVNLVNKIVSIYICTSIFRNNHINVLYLLAAYIFSQYHLMNFVLSADTTHFGFIIYHGINVKQCIMSAANDILH